MHINTQTRTFKKTAGQRPAPKAKAASTPGDQVEIDWSGHKPAHRDMKKLTRIAAAGTGAVGLGITAFKALTAATLGDGLVAAGIGLAATAAAVTAVDLGSGLAHHTGDNYFPRQSLKHTQWHTEPTNAEYCMAGFSNKALDAIEFWPKWEKLIHKTTGAEPVSWRVPEYKAYCMGEISKEELHATQLESGMLK